MKSKKKATGRKNSLLTRLVPKTRKGIVKVSIAAIVLVVVVGAIPSHMLLQKALQLILQPKTRKVLALNSEIQKYFKKGATVLRS